MNAESWWKKLICNFCYMVRVFCPLFYMLASICSRGPQYSYLDLSGALRPFPTVAEVSLKVAVNLLISSLLLTYVMWLWGLLCFLYQTKLVKFQPNLPKHTLPCWLIHAPAFQLFLLPHLHRYVVPLHSRPFILNAPTLWPLPFLHPSTVHRWTFPRPNPTHLIPTFHPWLIITINKIIIINERELHTYIYSHITTSLLSLILFNLSSNYVLMSLFKYLSLWLSC